MRAAIHLKGRSCSWLGRQDSNLRSRIQSPLPYRLATPHRDQVYGLPKVVVNQSSLNIARR